MSDHVQYKRLANGNSCGWSDAISHPVERCPTSVKCRLKTDLVQDMKACGLAALAMQEGSNGCVFANL